MFSFNKKNKQSSAIPDKFYRALFFQEEINGDKLVNYIRMLLVVLLLFLTLLKADVFTGLVISKSFIFTVIIMGASSVYAAILFFLFKNNIYHPVIKYISTTFDLTLLILSIYSYKFDAYEEYATIFFLGRSTLLIIFVTFAFLRYSFRLAIFAGLVGALEYWFFVIYNNHFTGLKFWFLGADGNTYTSFFSAKELYFKLIYIVLSGFIVGIFSLRIKNLVRKSIEREHDKNKLMMDNKIIDTINKESKKYLDNISEGLLLINKFFAIKGHYSKKLISIFETGFIEGENILDLIFPDKNSQAEKRKEFENFLNILFTNTNTDMDMIMEINPVNNETIYVESPDGSINEKIISANYHRIIKDGIVDEIMIIINDKTDLVNTEKKLIDEREKHSTELEYILAILKSNTSTLKLFFEDAHNLLSELESNIANLNDKNIINHFFRGVHSLKGNAGTFELKKISDLAHEIENYLSDIKDDKIQINEHVTYKIKSLINSVNIEFDDLNNLHDRFKKISNSNIAFNQNKSDNSDLENFFGTLVNMTDNISKELNKKAKLIINNKIDDFSFLNKIKNPVIHLIRNAIDHGIEDNFERLSENKDETGKIKLNLYKHNDNYHIEISDDGRGIDFNKVLNKAKEKSLIKADEKTIDRIRLLQLIFSPGFTTKNKIDSISGRGIGLDSVKEDVIKLKGKIKVNTEINKGTKFIISIPEK